MLVPPRLSAALLPFAAALLLAACGQPQQQQQAAPPPPTVTVAKPQTRTITEYDEYVGRFVAINHVMVNARVSGYLDKISFTDGQMVKEGDLLFTLDQRPYKIALDLAQANLAQAKANLDFATTDLERARSLLEDRNSTAISKQTFDQRTQSQRTAAATVQAQEATVAQARLDLQFTELKAPVGGRIGDRRVSVGNYVIGGAGATPTLLAVIVSMDPIYFEFTFDEGSLLRYQRMAGDVAGAPVDLKLIDDTGWPYKGKMDFLNNVVDRETGTIRGRAIFDNKTDLFRPGVFGRIRIASTPPYQALTVPDTAIGSQQLQKFVYVLGPENVIQVRPVVLGPLEGDRRVVKSGLGPDDVLVVNGLMRVRPGVKVTPQEEKPPQAGPAEAKAGSPATPAK
ncbi:efflux RND transporter periplasmic adaptor subunit [Aquabacter spiritensis]|uniref:RND family efflux transporter MFP subunit n=1 Tax=Aquabacter spiritensis TaxID=933073 RepID=A0A4R3LPD7_9HYPH|nr:efflux RND transporter periplasmic adaptor subunit [Aquabacter spiritensis]TCT02250.1 RND family efflux transporter MFP subunit [Aquabacter spiritensis]